MLIALGLMQTTKPLLVMIVEVYFEYISSDLVRTQYLEFYVLAARERAHKSEQQERTTNPTRTIRTTTTTAKPVDGVQ